MINALEKLTKAEQWLAEAKTLDDLKQIHDIALAAEAYAKAHKLGINSENHAREIKFVAARRIGELVPKETGGRGKKTILTSDSFPIPQRLTEFRKLAEKVTELELREKCHRMNLQEEKITYNKLILGDWYQSSESPEWETPQWLFDLLNKEFHFSLDVCASEKNHKCKKYFSRQNNGLKQKWQETCWMNPPYGREIAQWMGKAKIESENGAIIVCLVPARPDTEWWWNNCIQGEIRFIRGRLQWPGSDTMAPFPSAVIILGDKIKSKVVWWDVQSK